MAQSGLKRDVDKNADWDDDEPARKKHISKVTNFASKNDDNDNNAEMEDFDIENMFSMSGKEKSKNENENDNNNNENDNGHEYGARMKEKSKEISMDTYTGGDQKNDVPDFVASFGNSNEHKRWYGYGYPQVEPLPSIFATTNHKSNDNSSPNDNSLKTDTSLQDVLALFQGTELKPKNIANVQEWKQYVSRKCQENCISKREKLKVCEYAHSMKHSQLIEDGLHGSGVGRAKLIGNFDSIDKLKEWMDTHKGDFQGGTYYVIPSKPFTYVKDELIHEIIVMKDEGFNLIRNPDKKPYPYPKEYENDPTLGKKAWFESQKGEIKTKRGLKDILKKEYSNMPAGQVTQKHLDMDKVNKLGRDEYMRILSQANEEYMNENFGTFLNAQFDGLTRPNIQIWNTNPNNPCHSFDLSSLFRIPGLKSGDSKERCNLLGIGHGACFDTLKEFMKCFDKLIKQKGYIDEKEEQYKEPTTIYVREDTYKPVNGVYDDDEAERGEKWSKFTVQLS